MKEHRDVVEHSIEAFVREVMVLALDGWVVSKTNPGDAVGFGSTYTVSMYRDSDSVAKLKQIGEAVAEKPKMTRAEILQKARAARKVKLDVNKII